MSKINSFKVASKQFAWAADELGLTGSLRRDLSKPQKVHKFRIKIRMDNGKKKKWKDGQWQKNKTVASTRTLLDLWIQRIRK